MASQCFDLDSMSPQTMQQFCAPSTTVGQNVNKVLSQMAPDTDNWGSLPEMAYALATFKWETANTFAPIHELGSFSYFDKYEPGTPLGAQLGNTTSGDGLSLPGAGVRADYRACQLRACGTAAG